MLNVLRFAVIASLMCLIVRVPGWAAATCDKMSVAAISASTDDGNVASNSVDGNLSTRWSGYGVGANVTLDVGAQRPVCGLKIAWYKGDTRQNYFAISVSGDGLSYRGVYTGVSSGQATVFETYSFAPISARYVRVTVNGNSVNAWASILEIQAFAAAGVCATLPVSAVNASTDDGNVAAGATDGNLSTRWSGSGVGAYITADLGSIKAVCGVGVAWYQGMIRRSRFVVSTSTDGAIFQPVYSGTSSGATEGIEAYFLSPAAAARYVRITVNGNTINTWASITELQVNGRAVTYDDIILSDRPVAFWDLTAAASTERDLTGQGHTAAYLGGLPDATSMPNGEGAAVLNGSSEYISVPSAAAFSIPTTGNLTWELWIRPDVLQFPASSTSGYIDLLGKCASYSPTCEWEGRLYNSMNPEARCSRLSAYVFNPTAGLGSGADWQPNCGLLRAGEWLHVVGEYTLLAQPADCQNTDRFPGSIDIWVNGVKWNHSYHGQTGCMSQYRVVAKSNDSPLNIGTMARDTWFKGGVGKGAVYDYKLSDAQIAAHFRAMTGSSPVGRCLSTCEF